MYHWQLKQRQSLPLECKINITINRIHNFYNHYRGEVYVAFSGGKDSTVLADIVTTVYKNVKLVFCDTGLEYPSVRKFAMSKKNVVVMKPKMNFKKVLETYGYPVISKEQSMAISRYLNTKREDQKHYRLFGSEKGKKGVISKKYRRFIRAPFKISDKCCDIMKKEPFHRYEKETGEHPIIGTMVGESTNRMMMYLKTGCNAFELGTPKSTPLSFWTEKDIWEYIKLKNIPYADIYDKGEKRTGCIFCMYGVQYEQEPNRFQRLEILHPELHDYCMNKLGLKEILEYMKVPYRNTQMELF